MDHRNRHVALPAAAVKSLPPPPAWTTPALPGSARGDEALACLVWTKLPPTPYNFVLHSHVKLTEQHTNP
ncbi:hypothetical protein E2C01_100713 [Portunus trituberculatus]|uniref:Uncharacterized protein n=1 Tax=Portunus trituberculatus TaxID=210409 RepID=A0A5B7KDQ7_PORTR|nr:hypothetical protein [Portunus trituberculatus]